MRRLVAAGCFTLAFATASCAALLGFDRLEEGTLGPDGAPFEEASSDGDGGPDPRCVSLGVPDPPTGPSGGAMEITGALRTLDFGVSLDGGVSSAPGFNLDRTCSTTLETSSCTAAITASSFDGLIADKAGGIDNSAFGLLALISGVSTTFNTDSISRGVSDGLYGATFRVRGWNGQPNDTDLDVEFFPALGSAGGGMDGGLAYDTTDRWLIDQRFRLAVDVDGAAIRSQSAYLRDGQLVARFKSLTIEAIIGDDTKPFEITLDDAVLTGKLEGEGGSFLAGGVLGGRWSAARFLDQVRQIYVRNGNGILRANVCEGGDAGRFLYDTVKSFTCDVRDLRGDSQDNRGLPCDSVSAAARIEGYRTGIGTWTDFAAIPVRCADAGDFATACPN